MLNIVDYIQESMDGERFESMDYFKENLHSIVESMVEDIYTIERRLADCDPEELEENLGVIIDF